MKSEYGQYGKVARTIVLVPGLPSAPAA